MAQTFHYVEFYDCTTPSKFNLKKGAKNAEG